MSKEVAQQIHDKAAPFIKWLAEAEEEESSEEEGDVEVRKEEKSMKKTQVAYN